MWPNRFIAEEPFAPEDASKILAGQGALLICGDHGYMEWIHDKFTFMSTVLY